MRSLGPALRNFVNGPLASFKTGLSSVKGFIDSVKSAFDKLANAIRNFKLPSWLQRKSPSPLEQAFIGANEAIKQLQTEFPKLSAQLQAASPIAASPQPIQTGAPINITVNASVNNDIDIYRMARQISEQIKRGR